METDALIVSGWRYDLRELELTCGNAFKLANAHRIFGTQRLVVAGTDRDRRLLGLVHCPITDVPELALGHCIDTLQRKCNGPAAIVAYSDEPLCPESTFSDPTVCFFRRRAAAPDLGVHLVDWMFCHGDFVLSLKFRTIENPTWWDLP